MNYKKYSRREYPERALNAQTLNSEHLTDAKVNTSKALKTFSVKARRRFTPGEMSFTYQAENETQVRARFEEGEIPGIGLGWVIVDIQETA